MGAPTAKCHRRSPSTTERVDARDLCDVVTVALRNTIRTAHEQEALVRVATLLDNELVVWSAEARDTWVFTPCSNCDGPLPVSGERGGHECS